MTKALDAIQHFLDNVDEDAVRVKVYGSLQKVLGKAFGGIQGPKHPLFRILLGNLRKVGFLHAGCIS
jgi:hypothetical protein